MRVKHLFDCISEYFFFMFRLFIEPNSKFDKSNIVIHVFSFVRDLCPNLTIWLLMSGHDFVWFAHRIILFFFRFSKSHYWSKLKNKKSNEYWDSAQDSTFSYWTFIHSLEYLKRFFSPWNTNSKNNFENQTVIFSNTTSYWIRFRCSNMKRTFPHLSKAEYPCNCFPSHNKKKKKIVYT